MGSFIHVENLRLKFPKEESLLFKDLNITIHKGEKVLLLGPSGCGKSTLLQVLAGIIPRSIEVPMKYDTLEIPDSSGYLFQDPESQFCMPYVDEEIAFVLENLQIPREFMKERIHDYLSQVGLDQLELHTNIQTLSGGQKQRVAIASTLALEPDVLFLDEPTALLDHDGTKEVWDTIKQVMDNKTLIIIEHKIDHVIELIDRVIVFNDKGEIIADGEKEFVLNTYESSLRDHGIWYPGVWDRYLSERGDEPEIESPKNVEPIISLKDFEVLRNKKPLSKVEEATVFTHEWIAIVGENGAGKSTLLLGLMQLLKTSGTYKLNGNQNHRKRDLSLEIGFVFQNPEFQFVTHSVFDEMAHSLRLAKEDDQKVIEETTKMLKRFLLEDHKHKHPYQLSMGQKRRLSVAASIMQNQSVLLLDEPTFGQDSKNTFALLEYLEEERKKGTTILMVTHDKHIVENFATRVWTISSGELVLDKQSNKKSHQLILSV